jgi:broad specificity phosphatase PhoE
MLGALVDIARVHEGAPVVAVSHGGIIRATRRALGAADLHLPNLGGSWFTVDGRGGVAAGQVVMLHDAGERTSRVPTSPAPTPAAPAWQVL